jgi:hypothetical protein
MATGSYSAEEVRKWINSKGIPITKQVLLNMIRNHVYISKIFVKAYGNDSDQIVQGLYPPIII